MLFFILSVFFTVALYLIMRSYPQYRVNSFHAIVFNYYACVLTGLVLTPDLSAFQQVDYGSTGVLLTFALGALFVGVFLMIGLTAQKVSVNAASLAGNMSLVIPVLFGLFVFKNNNKEFTVLNYAGLIVALVALALGAVRNKQTPDKNNAGKRVNTLIVLLPILAFLSSGTNNTLINHLSSRYFAPGQTTVFMIIACLGSVVIGTSILLFKVIVQKEILTLRSLVGGFLLGVPNFLSLYFLLLALGSFGNSAAFVFPIYNILTMLVSAFAAFLFYCEKLGNLNRLGLALAVLAIVLISYQELGLN
jgi:hypothetical protein